MAYQSFHQGFVHQVLVQQTFVRKAKRGCSVFVMMIVAMWMVVVAASMNGMNKAQAQDVFSGKDVRIVNPGAPLNHEGLDYAPAISADGKTLFFVSNRPGSRRNAKGDRFSHDFWSATKASRLDTVFSMPVNIDTVIRRAGNGLNTVFNEGVPTISANRRMMFFTGCDRPDVLRKKKKVDGYDQEYECDIYVVELQPSGEWGVPRNLGPTVNSEDWDGHPSLSPTGDRLYFASNRPGGFGDADIWYSDYNAQTRSWMPAKNAGRTINTPYRDWSPFIAANNRELFFSSDGHKPNYGGTDFYVSVRDAGDKWSQPRNLGMPINTAADEAFLSTPAERDVLYFASERKDIRGAQGAYDIFMAFVPRNTLSLAIPLVGSVVDGCTGLATSATIVVYNPLTKRQFRDTLDTQKHTTFETIINDFDFGGMEKPADTAKIQIFAENPQFGRIFEELRIPRPKLNAQGVFEKFELPPVRLRFGGQPDLNVMLPEPTPSALQRKPLAALMRSGFAGFAMEEVVSVSVNRILNYVFFDPDSKVIPPRYVLFKNASDTATFDEEKLRGETLDKYYHTLNVFGARLRRFPKSVITITGCVDATEAKTDRKNTLAKARADAVASYLRTIWGIASNRMKIVARGLPAVPSNRNDSLGNEENRRVEIVCDDWDITKPVVDRSPLVFTTAPYLSVTTSPLSAEQVNEALTAQKLALQKSLQQAHAGTQQHVHSVYPYRRRLLISRGGMLFHTIELAPTTNTIQWNWKNLAGELPGALAGANANAPLELRLSVTDKSGRECLSGMVTIPVRRITTEDKQRESAQDKSSNKTLERYNLIMFPFDKSDVGPMNGRILREYVLPRLVESSDVMIVGHTDIIGEEQYNKTLSESRGANAREEVARLLQAKKMSVALLESKGVGEFEPLFDNRLPEGRFYNRTVQVLIETPVEDVKQIEQASAAEN